LHGANHTRRVNFLANVLIMKNIGTLSPKKEAILAAVKNHDIGRKNDSEDKIHGEYATKILEENKNRLEKFNDKERKQILFAIREHSLSKKENEEDFEKLCREKLQEEKGKEYSPETAYEEYVQKMERYGKEPETFEIFYNKLKEKTIYDEKIVMDVLKNVDKLDRVRLDPYGINIREGLDTNRFTGGYKLISTAKDMEYLAYESLNKVTQLFDVERDIRDLEEFIHLEKGVKKIEENMPLAKKNIEDAIKSKKTLINEINVGGLTKINEVVKKFKNKIMFLFQERDGNKKNGETKDR